LVDAGLTPQTTSIRSATYKLLLDVTNYGVFSNDLYPGPHTDPGTYQSIEAIHNNIHVSVGRGGHMNVPDFAAFDPIFWLHHANVSNLITDTNLFQDTERRNKGRSCLYDLAG
jgi:tyrosinase